MVARRLSATRIDGSRGDNHLLYACRAYWPQGDVIESPVLFWSSSTITHDIGMALDQIAPKHHVRCSVVLG